MDFWIAQFPAALNEDTGPGWKMVNIFQGSIGGFSRFSCHLSTLGRQVVPHEPHQHLEEEILLVLAGEVDLIIGHPNCRTALPSLRLAEGDFAYYPPGLAHTLQGVSPSPARYLAVRWQRLNRPPEDNPRSPVVCRADEYCEKFIQAAKGFAISPITVVDQKTQGYLAVHHSRLSPGVEHRPHADPYDLLIVLLKGKLLVLGRILQAPAAVFHAAAALHWLKNPEDHAADYIAFEFHNQDRRQ